MGNLLGNFLVKFVGKFLEKFVRNFVRYFVKNICLVLISNMMTYLSLRKVISTLGSLEHCKRGNSLSMIV